MQANRILKQLPLIAIDTNIYEERMTAVISCIHSNNDSTPIKELEIKKMVKESWSVIAPAWPLTKINAVNPLQGFEELSFEKALIEARAYFQDNQLPKSMEAVNRENIKWLQAYFDKGQSTIKMPQKSKGLFLAWKQLAIYDKRLHQKDSRKIDWFKSLSDSPAIAIQQCLTLLKIQKEEEGTQFIKIILTSLNGWASYIKYLGSWAESKIREDNLHTEIDFLAARLAIVCLLYPEAKLLLALHKNSFTEKQRQKRPLEKMEQVEKLYQHSLLKDLATSDYEDKVTPAAQLLFCIDVRSEPFRKAIESRGAYETFGFAGFFGIPVQITDPVTKDSHPSCPVLLSPKHEVNELPCDPNSSLEKDLKGYERLRLIRKLYQSVKYNFTTPFGMVEGIGLLCAGWLAIQTLSPNLSFNLKKRVAKSIRKPAHKSPQIENISIQEQSKYAEDGLRMIGLTSDFAPLVVVCGHGSSTENNAFSTSLDCGACGGRGGSSNASMFAMMLNNPEVRVYLASVGITIPEKTQFIGAEHNTTTDAVILFDAPKNQAIEKLKLDLKKAQIANNIIRLKKMKVKASGRNAEKLINRRSKDFSEVRPEWGLARNAALIVGPRSLSKCVDLDGRCFLHSYNYSQDPNGAFLKKILTAPMVVAQWINAQYLFSTLDNASYGGGSKITINITGKHGVMQGNASDLMTGLPLQSVYSSDKDPYHEAQRLVTIVYAKRSVIDSIIEKEKLLQKLFENRWIKLASIDPETKQRYSLERDLTWIHVS